MEHHTVTVWPADLKTWTVRKETPFMLLHERAGWLPRTLWWALKRMRVLVPFSETVQRWTFEPSQKELCAAMLEAANHDLRFVYEDKAVFVIGSKTFHELTGSPEFRDQMRFLVGPVRDARPAFRAAYVQPAHPHRSKHDRYGGYPSGDC